MNFIKELQSRLKAKQRAWEKAKDEVREAKGNESRVRDELLAVRILLNAEQPKTRKRQEKPVPVALPPKSDTNKAEVVRTIVSEHAATGLTPAQVREKLRERNVKANGNYLYAILLRARKAGHMIEKKGRYYPAEEEKAAS